MLKVGDLFKTKTTTKNDVFGTVVWRVEEIGKKCPDCKGDDAVKCVMVSGTGPAARPGYPVIDCLQNIERNIAAGVSELLSEAVAKRVLDNMAATKATPTHHAGTGVVEV